MAAPAGTIVEILDVVKPRLTPHPSEPNARGVESAQIPEYFNVSIFRIHWAGHHRPTTKTEIVRKMMIEPSGHDTAVEFDSDGPYLKWIAEHQDFYVLTSNKSLSPRHTVIHRASCTKISALTGNAKPGGFTRSYTKVGAPTIAILQEWVQRMRPDAKYRECSVCAGK